MVIDWASVNWLYVAVLAVFVFFTSLIGNLVAFRRHVLGGLVSAVLFAATFVFWTYYPHHLPLPTRPGDITTPVVAPAQKVEPAAPAAPPSAVKPGAETPPAKPNP